MRVYVIEYRYYSKPLDAWHGKLSQEGYKTLREAQAYIEGRPNEPLAITAMYYQTSQCEEYYIHDILIN